MSEPLYCSVCGAEDWECGHSPYDEGPYCEVDGVIHETGDPCFFNTRDENRVEEDGGF